MQVRNIRVFTLLLLGVLLMTPHLTATTMIQMDLADLVQRADRIFRGTVLEVNPGSLEAGGGELSTTTYVLRVEDHFKGAADQVKGDTQIMEVRMIGTIKAPKQVGDVRHFSVLYDVPKLKVGGDYLLLTTPASAIGLSTTVGLGQGAFTIFSQDREDFAVNEFNNQGLGLDGTGPVAYSELATKILALLGQ